MLVARLSQHPRWVFFGTAVTVLTVSWAVAASSIFLMNPRVLSIAVTLDVAVMIPAAYWFLVVRCRHAHLLTMIPIIGLCILAVAAIVPSGHAGILVLAQHLIAPAEIGLLVYIAYKLRAVLLWRDGSLSNDPVEAATAALQRALGNAFAARLIASEFAMLYYAVGCWGRPPSPDGAFAFAPTRSVGLLAVLVPIVVLETVGVHMLVSMWSMTAAWILTALSAYTMLWVFGDYRAMAKRPSFVKRDEVVIRVGLRCSLRARLAQIELVRTAGWRDEGRSRRGHLNMASPDSPNILVIFREPITVQRIFGMQTTVRTIALRVQDPDGMMRALSYRKAENILT
jgi:hypothetical protein